ncbi:hypothetical protein SOPP22_01655 [Shewanella sp. OPT22]|nr:hypothetical protein SOPP22_01655 [Shewanella sp. OPT22]
MKKAVVIFLAFTSALLSGCMNIPLTTMYKMMTMNPMDIDPRHLVVAVGSPKNISVQDGDIEIKFEYKSPNKLIYIEHQFLVKVDPNYPLPTELKEEEQEKGKITVLKLSEQDAEKMYQAQQEIKAYREKHDDGSGTFYVKINSTCIIKNYKARELELDLFLKLYADEEFFTFLEDVDVMELRNKSKLPSNKVTECAKS